MDDTSLPDSSALQNLLGGSTPSLIPESLVTTLTISFVVLNILGLLFFVFYVVSQIRKWKVDSAVLSMQKDLADIKAHLSSQPPKSDVASPADSNRIIAQTDDTRSA